jgi:ssRNA-specific RNase YbeY (16S rRNA maturation enzyme)
VKASWEKIKDKVLGKKYDLSVVLADDAMMKKLNETYHKKKGATNVLSFPLSPEMGEIFINKNADNKDFLFIHSLLHLKGLKHGKIMEKEEQKIWRETLSQA